ncbi:hypothetical protein [Aeromicrobium fastidiosum]|uniref:hypothetical protein n=1 Tax=Aeromicrobium fastidiosum TaxID=52699 RepID=UPI00165EDEC9|nr:hypothetical protein [Aeromicrobium fastidiosum]MBP2392126.1 hypothetical protein [Aeromicrobium fastidiosum]
MTQKQLWTIAGMLFVVSAIASLIGGNTTIAIAFVAVGLSFLAMPSYLDRGRKR